jgi:hypothetical protein
VGLNYIVQRQTPDWLNFDVEQSRPFLKSAGLDEGLVVEFVGIWDKAFRIGYREWRDRIKTISVANYRAVENARLISRANFDAIPVAPDDLVVFVDDDDWLRADLFNRLRGLNVSGHGARWGSVRVGLVGGPTRFDPDISQIALRPLSPVLFTNNYAVTGALLQIAGTDRLFQHFVAQMGIRSGHFQPVPVAVYLSAANKHVCSTMSARHLLASEHFRTDPKTVVSATYDDLNAATIPAAAEWIRPALSEYLALFAEAIR